MKIRNIGNRAHSISFRKLAKPTGLCLIAIFAISMLSVLSTPPANAATSSMALHTSGKQILTQDGTPVVLRGVDYSFFISAPTGSWMLPNGQIEWLTWDPVAVNSNLDALKANGVNSIRVLGTTQYWIQNTNNFRNNLEYFISQAQARGIYVTFVFWENGGNQGQSSLPYPPYDNSGIINSVGDFANVWTSVANALKGYSSVMFELWNEPNGDGNAAASWFSATQQCINAIRATGATNPVVVQWSYALALDWQNYQYGSIWGLEWVNQYPLTDSANNLIYSTHIYRSNFYNDANSNDGYAYSMSDMQWALTKLGVIGFNKPLWIGEIGCSLWATNLNNEYQWFTNTLELLNQNGIGYAAWAWAPWSVGTQWSLVSGNANYELNQAGQLLMTKVKAGIALPIQTPTPAPIVTPTPVPIVTPTPEPIVIPIPPEPTPTLEPIIAPTPVPTATPTPVPTASPTAVPTATPTPRLGQNKLPTPAAPTAPASSGLTNSLHQPSTFSHRMNWHIFYWPRFQLWYFHYW